MSTPIVRCKDTTNAEKFHNIFGRYATEIYALPENEFLEWLNEECNENEVFPLNLKHFKCSQCDHEYYGEILPQWDEEYGYHYWTMDCPYCGCENEVNDCYWR